MKYAEEIAKEIKERGPIDTTGCIVDKDDAWENYIRGKGSTPREKRNHVSIMPYHILQCFEEVKESEVKDEEEF